MITLPTAIRAIRNSEIGDQVEYVRGVRKLPPEALLPRDALQDLRVDVEVGVDGVDVVLILERVDQPQQLAGAVLVERDARLGLLGDLGGLDLDPGLSSDSRTAVRSAGSQTIS